MQNSAGLNLSLSTVDNSMPTKCNLSIKQAQSQPCNDINLTIVILDVSILCGKKQRSSKDMTGYKSGNKFTKNCVFLNETAFHISLKQSMARSKKGTPVIVTVPSTKANIASILCAISTTGLINVSLRVPKRIQKRKLGPETDVYSKGTVIGHYLSFLKATIDVLLYIHL
ncbi:hypothetical protein BY458DRAFT_582531 [Sporodiniella umbellata]|nr:hypothetical protein BY458DRAFT_582531 [Sporodiniella umbellata]